MEEEYDPADPTE